MVTLGDSTKFEIVFLTTDTRFDALEERQVDVLTQSVTINMERDVNVKGFDNFGITFSTPYFYDGMAFGGIPQYVDCADDLIAFGDEICRALAICVQVDTTHEQTLNEIFRGATNVMTTSFQDSVSKLKDGQCNVIVGDSSGISESRVRTTLNYQGEYKLGVNRFSKEPLAIATRDGDMEWSKIANMVIDVLISAEKYQITQSNVMNNVVLGGGTNGLSSITTLQDDMFRQFFVDVVSTVGNMGELYQRYFQDEFPRFGLNLLNNNDDDVGVNMGEEEGVGLIYSFPFGDVANSGEVIDGGIIDSILTRQKLRCGVTGRPGFAQYDPKSDLWSGIDIEFCVGVSAALFTSLQGRNQIEFVEIANSTDRLGYLARGEIDILAGERVTLQTLWEDPQTKIGYSFSPPYFYDGDDSPYALATLQRDGDSQWSDFVYWIVLSTFYAEEIGVTQASAVELPVVSLFGERYSPTMIGSKNHMILSCYQQTDSNCLLPSLSPPFSLKQMFLDTIWEVGNYGNIYNRTMETLYPRNPGRNMVNSGSSPQMFGYPLE